MDTTTLFWAIQSELLLSPHPWYVLVIMSQNRGSIEHWLRFLLKYVYIPCIEGLQNDNDNDTLFLIIMVSRKETQDRKGNRKKKRVVVLWPTECWARLPGFEKLSRNTQHFKAWQKKEQPTKNWNCIALDIFGTNLDLYGYTNTYVYIYMYIRLFGSVWFSLESHFHGHFPSHWTVGIRRCFIHLAHLAGVSSGFLMKLIHQT